VFFRATIYTRGHVTGEPRVQHFSLERQNETIDYNERFSWDNPGWLVSRAFFGPYGESRVSN